MVGTAERSRRPNYTWAGEWPSCRCVLHNSSNPQSQSSVMVLTGAVFITSCFTDFTAAFAWPLL